MCVIQHHFNSRATVLTTDIAQCITQQKRDGHFNLAVVVSVAAE